MCRRRTVFVQSFLRSALRSQLAGYALLQSTRPELDTQSDETGLSQLGR